MLNSKVKKRPIIKLEDKIANQIAAGEVIERPSAIIKELLENSIDAGANSIDVLISQGGKAIIRVKDDGWGISKAELPIAVCRHATSKLVDNDISNVNTYGFRGEALPSIGSSSRLTIKSKAVNSEEAWEILVDNDNIKEIIPASLNVGTCVEVRDLFFKTPARLKFLKSDKIEQLSILDIFKKLSLINPHISFSLREILPNGSDRILANYKVLSKIDSGNYEYCSVDNNKYSERVSQILGKEIFQNLLPIGFSDDNITIGGYISLPTFSRSTSSYQYFFVNGRFVSDKNLASAIRVGFSDFIMKGRYPVAIVFINCPNDKVDANVHPAKTEVRFQDLNYVKNSIISTIKSSIANFNTKTSSEVSDGMMRAFRKNSFSHGKLSYSRDNQFRQELNNYSSDLFRDLSSRNFQKELSPDVTTDNGLLEEIDETLLSLGSPVAHIHENYIISQTENGMIIIDQHAAHERIVYEKLKKSLKNNSISSQALLIPEIVELGEERSDIILKFTLDFEKLGVILEPFGKKSICVRSTPEILGEINCSTFLNDVADELLEHENFSVAEDKLEQIISKMACHGSVRSGKKLKLSEMSFLLRAMEETPYSNQCNHGRPTFIELKLKDIEKLFNRN